MKFTSCRILELHQPHVPLFSFLRVHSPLLVAPKIPKNNPGIQILTSLISTRRLICPQSRVPKCQSRTHPLRRLDRQAQIFLHQLDFKPTAIALARRGLWTDARHGIPPVRNATLRRTRLEDARQDPRIHAGFHPDVHRFRRRDGDQSGAVVVA